MEGLIFLILLSWLFSLMIFVTDNEYIEINIETLKTKNILLSKSKEALTN